MNFDLANHLKSAGRSVRLYVYGRDGYHGGGLWVATVPPRKYPDEEIFLSEALDMVKNAEENGLEVRITNGLDEMVYHSMGGVPVTPLEVA